MKPDIEFYILFSITILAMVIKTSYGIIMICLMFFVYATNFFFTTYGLYTDTKLMENKVLFYKTKKTKENYSEAYSNLSEYYNIIKTLNLDNNKYLPCGVFFDDPSIKDKNNSKLLRYCYGLLLDRINYSKDLDSKLKEKGFLKWEFNSINFVHGYYTSFFSLNGSFIWITKIISEMSMNKFFSRVFNVKWKDKNARGCKKIYQKHHITVITYEDHQSNFYLPVEAEESLLNLYSSSNFN